MSVPNHPITGSSPYKIARQIRGFASHFLYPHNQVAAISYKARMHRQNVRHRPILHDWE